MGDRSDGMTYAPTGGPIERVVEPGAFVFAAAHLDHGHIYGQVAPLKQAGGTLRYVYDTQPERAAAFGEAHPEAQIVDDLGRILDDPEVRLVASAAVPSERCAIGLRVMDAGKDYFTDKSPFTTHEQLESARAAVAATGRKYMVYYGERLANEAAVHATKLIADGAVGRVLQVITLAPHRLSKASRPDWFFDKARYGGILTDIGSHQFEQFLAFTGAADATVNAARVENFANPDAPGLEDFGEALVTTDTGASCYCRVDWFTPDGSEVWGDGRTFVLGTAGTMELRKYIDPATTGTPSDVVILVDGEQTRRIECAGRVGFPFFGELILDVLNRTEHAMTQAHAFKAAELSMLAQRIADDARAGRG